ncbi:MAG: ABC transporter ATP-binding protein/permease [Anaerolineae bacterium]|nr:ABC transporter ATP-binding protein/permease [Anaerolineae bacterium]
MTAEFIARTPIKTDHRNPLRFIFSHIRRHPIFAFLMVLGAFSNAALAAAIPYFVGLGFNAMQAERPDRMQFIGMVALATIGSQLLRAVLQLMRNFSAEVFAQRIERDVRDELYASLLGKSMTFHDLKPVGEIMARVTNDVREMNLMMNPGMNLIVGSGFFLITPVIGALQMHPLLAVPPILFLIAYVIVQWNYVRRLTPLGQEQRKAFGDMNARVAEVLDGVQVVKGSAQEEREKTAFGALADTVRKTVETYSMLEARYIPVLLLGLVYAGGLVMATSLYRAGAIPIGSIVAYLGQISLFGFPVFSSLASFSQVALGYASTGRILDIIKAENDLDQNVDGYAGNLRGEIVFENVDFSYVTGDNVVLQDVSFRVTPGQTVAIVGQTGSGKSTITKLINRTYDVDTGKVSIDGVDVRDWNLTALRSQISIIEQDIFLFSRSIADNIAFGKPDATREDVIEAATKAQAHEFILSFDDGYDTIVGQRGVTLSGGQRQRIAIARAFLTDPPVLILDDSTSAIDSATEDKIQQAIYAASAGRTMILITHRLSQIRWADHIVVLRKGRVAAQGTHEDLLRTSESYRRIFARYEAAPKDQQMSELAD